MHTKNHKISKHFNNLRKRLLFDLFLLVHVHSSTSIIFRQPDSCGPQFARNVNREKAFRKLDSIEPGTWLSILPQWLAEKTIWENGEKRRMVVLEKFKCALNHIYRLCSLYLIWFMANAEDDSMKYIWAKDERSVLRIILRKHLEAASE